jgi:hypothetical protein
MDSKKIMIYGGIVIVLLIIVAIVMIKEKFTTPDKPSFPPPPSLAEIQQRMRNAPVTESAQQQPSPSNLISMQQYLQTVGPKLSSVSLYLSPDALDLLSDPVNVTKLLNSINNFQLMTTPSPTVIGLKVGVPAGVDQSFNGYIEFNPAPASGINKTVGIPFGKTLDYTYNDMEGVYRRIQDAGVVVGGVPQSVDLQRMDESEMQ